MQISIEEKEGLARTIAVEVPEEQIDKKLSQKYDQLSKTVKIDGFRKGKVPIKVIKQRFGDSVQQEVIGDVLQTSLFEALNEKSLNPAASPKITNVDYEPGNPLSFSADFDVMPQIDIVDMAGESVESLSCDISDADIDNTVDKLREQHLIWNEVDREVQDGDKLDFDFTGRVDGEAFDGGSATHYSIIVGKGQFLKDFEAGLLGKTAKKSFNIDVKFPEDYGSKDLAGKDAVFEILIHSISGPTLPEVDLEFVKKFNKDTDSIDGFRADVRKSMDRELSARIKDDLKKKVLECLLNKHEIDLPESLVDQEVQRLAKSVMQGQNRELDDNIKNMLKSEAERRVRLGLLINAYVKEKELTVDHERVKQFISEQASTYERPEEVVQWYLGSKERLAEVEAIILEDQVVDMLLESISVTKKELPYEDIVSKR